MVLFDLTHKHLKQNILCVYVLSLVEIRCNKQLIKALLIELTYQEFYEYNFNELALLNGPIKL